jgi:hypothetical protein
MAAGSERPPRIDDDGDCVPRRVRPGGTHPESSDPHRPVEVAPPLLPPGLDWIASHAAEHMPQPLFARGVRIRSQLDSVLTLELLETLREELEHDGSR